MRRKRGYPWPPTLLEEERGEMSNMGHCRFRNTQNGGRYEDIRGNDRRW